MVRIWYVDRTVFGGQMILSREFFNPETRAYIEIEAHEMEKEGEFKVAFWVPEGNDGNHGFDGGLRHVVKSMSEYQPPTGFIEMAIPDEAWDA